MFFFFIVAVGHFSLWQLADFYCGSWPFFIVAVGKKNSRPFLGAGVFI